MYLNLLLVSFVAFTMTNASAAPNDPVGNAASPVVNGGSASETANASYEAARTAAANATAIKGAFGTAYATYLASPTLPNLTAVLDIVKTQWSQVGPAVQTGLTNSTLNNLNYNNYVSFPTDYPLDSAGLVKTMAANSLALSLGQNQNLALANASYLQGINESLKCFNDALSYYETFASRRFEAFRLENAESPAGSASGKAADSATNSVKGYWNQPFVSINAARAAWNLDCAAEQADKIESAISPLKAAEQAPPPVAPGN